MYINFMDRIKMLKKAVRLEILISRLLSKMENEKLSMLLFGFSDSYFITLVLNAKRMLRNCPLPKKAIRPNTGK
jgi:hypothetical protein